MPGYKMHIFGGSLIYALLLYLATYWMMPSASGAFEWFCFAMLGALFPDIDIKSKGQKLFYRFFGVLLIFLAVQGRFELAAVFGIIVLVPMVVRHRGLFHEPWFLVVLPLVIAGATSLYFPSFQQPLFIDAFFFIVGAWSHIVLDRGIRGIIRF